MKISSKVTGILAAALAAFLLYGCATQPPQTVSHLGRRIPRWLLEQAEGGTAPAADLPQITQAEACALLSGMLVEYDFGGAIRYLRKGAALRDGDCCLLYLSLTERERATVSHRIYAKLFVKDLLSKGAIYNRSGKEITSDLYWKLCWSWRFTHPVDLTKAAECREALIQTGFVPPRMESTFAFGQRRKDGLARATWWSQPFSNDENDSPKERDHAWETNFRVSASTPYRGTHSPVKGRWETIERIVNYFGSDGLCLNARVLAFRVNAKREPVFNGTRLWIRNLGRHPVYFTSPFVGLYPKTVAPGSEETFLLTSPVGDSQRINEVTLSVRFWNDDPKEMWRLP